MTLQRIETARGHWYKLDGNRVDGVTTLLKDGIPKPQLVSWAARSVAEYVAGNRDAVTEMWDQASSEDMVAALKGTPYAQRDAAARRGTDVHDLAEKLSHGQQVDVPEELAGYVQAAVRWLDDWQARPIITERPVASRKWWYAGTLDAVWEMPDGTRWITDWKTTASGIWGETALQAAAYTHAEFYLDADGHEQSMADLKITRGLGVHLRADGTYGAHELDITEATFSAFNRIAWLARHHKDMKRRLVSDHMPTPDWNSEDVPA